MLNKMIFQGRFTKPLELKQTANGVQVLNFTLAWNEKYGDKETNCFLNCVAYRNTAEFIQKYFDKGDLAIVEGKLTTRSYEKDGEKRYITELIVDKAHFCGSKKERDQESSQFTDIINIDEQDDLPF